ncbi:MAG TPA: molecular chaperone DnaK, partial [Methanocorpusculum sp.]|nr:molecular chaperone DnaK [Methanocorpusculum sp.]
KEDASTDDIKAKMDALQEVVFAVTSKMYQKIQEEQQAAQGAGCSGDCGSCGNDDNVVDADYEVKKD